MLDILQDASYSTFRARGFLDTGIALPSEIIARTRAHYDAFADGHNDSMKFVAGNEHLGYAESWAIGAIFTTFKKYSLKRLERLFATSYGKCIFAEQALIGDVLAHLLANGLADHFKARYMLASHDMYLRGSDANPDVTIHFDTPNFNHFHEGENDLSLYVPLVDLNAENGGRLSLLPEGKLKVPLNAALRTAHAHFSRDPDCLDENGYVDPDRIDPKKLRAFVKTAEYQHLLRMFRSLNFLARRHYRDEFIPATQKAGMPILFNNKNFHAVEKWRNPHFDREVYVIRMSPLHDVKIRLRRRLHGAVFNNFLIDMQERKVQRLPQAVDVAQIADSEKTPL